MMVFDSGRSISAVLRELKEKSRRNLPETIRIACPWFKPKKNQTEVIPDYYVHETGPMAGLSHMRLTVSTEAEIRLGKPDMADILFPN